MNTQLQLQVDTYAGKQINRQIDKKTDRFIDSLIVTPMDDWIDRPELLDSFSFRTVQVRSCQVRSGVLDFTDSVQETENDGFDKDFYKEMLQF